MASNKDPEFSSSENLYKPAGFVLVRAPLMPVDTFRALNKALICTAAKNIKTGKHSLPLEFSITLDTQSLHNRMQSLVNNPAIQEAILVGSPNLFESIPNWKQKPKSKKGQQAQLKLFRYLTRMSVRPTPFGLFAGTAFGKIDTEMSMEIGALEHNQKHTRLDMQWLLHSVRNIEREDSNISDHITYFTNPATYCFGGRLYIPYLDSYGQAESDKTASLRATSVVIRTLEIARKGATIKTLKEHLLIENPEATLEQIQGLLDALRDHGVILSDLRPSLTGTDPSHHILKKLNSTPGCTELHDNLQNILTVLETYDDEPIGKGMETLQSILETIKSKNPGAKPVLCVDMNTEIKQASFSKDVAIELAKAAETILRLSPTGPYLTHLISYRKEYIERYGDEREVPVLELLDEDIGLGPPLTYHHPARSDNSQYLPSSTHPERDRVLLSLASSALLNKQREVELDETILKRLQIYNSWQDKTPSSLELYAYIAARSQADINNGNYQIVIGPRIGAEPAGRSFGRFCNMLGAKSVKALSQLVHDEEVHRPECLFAELVYLPPDGHNANVIIRPAIRKYEIVLGTSPGVDSTKTIPIDDLVVGIHGERFYLRSISRNSEVVITNTHLLNYINAPNLCRFLTEISFEGVIRVAPFDWGVATYLPFLPRIRVGRTVLRPAEWHIPTHIVGPTNEKPDPVYWYERIQEWRRKWGVPRYTYLADSDNRLLLDLENPLCLTDLAVECRKRQPGQSTINLQEMLPGFDEIWAKGKNGDYLLEFVVPFKRCQPPATHDPLPVMSNVVTKPKRLHMLGGDWLYAKLYCSRKLQDDLLADPIRVFTKKVLRNSLAKRWFFIRYADPKPHIRLRFQGSPKDLLSQLLPDLTSWSRANMEKGLLLNLVLDSYEREIERYGGIEGIKLAEQIFAIDSILVTNIVSLKIQRSLDLDTLDLLIITVDDLLSNLGLLVNRRLHLYHSLKISQEKGFNDQKYHIAESFHGYHRTVQRMIGDKEWLREQPGGNQLEVYLCERAEVLRPIGDQLRLLGEGNKLWVSQDSFLSSCIHMHCNRLVGNNRLMEYKMAYCLYAALNSFQYYVPNGINI